MTGFIKRSEDLMKVLAAFITAQLTGALLMYLLSGLGSGFVFNILLNIMCTLAVNAAVFLMFSGKVRLPQRADGYLHIEPMMFFFAAVFLASLAGMLVKLLPSAEGTAAMPAGMEMVLYCAYTVLLAPITEELVFRGAVLTMLAERGRSVSALISAAAFAAYHMSFVQLPYTFVLGFFLALLAQRSGRLLPCIIVHAANNALTLAATYSDTASRITDIALPIFGVASLLWLIFTGRLFQPVRKDISKR